MAEKRGGNGSSSTPRLLLVGAGHAHMEVLRRLIQLPDAPSVDLCVVSQSDKHHYSGMVPGYLNGTYREDEISFHLPPIVALAGGEFIQKRACGIDPAKRVVRLDGDQEIGYDLVSFNLGSRTLGDTDPSVSQNAALVKPMTRAVDLRQRIVRLANREGTQTRHGVVVGGGSAGVEVAYAMASVLDGAGRRRKISIVEGSDRILSGYSEGFRRHAKKLLEERGIELHKGKRVVEVHADGVELEDGSRIDSELTVWLTGPASSPVFRDSGLELDKRGFLLVDDSLRSVNDPRILGVGDCVTLARYPDTPKAGVYAVREAPILWESLLAAMERGVATRYRPQDGFLSILNTADGKALLRYKALVTHSRWAWWVKDKIDRNFMSKYHALT